VPFPRPLTATEKAVASNLLEKAEAPELDLLARQLEAAPVTSECKCGCPTISMVVDASRASPVSYSAKPIATADYDGGSVMIWVEDGSLSHLEIYRWSDDARTAFPDLDHLITTASVDCCIEAVPIASPAAPGLSQLAHSSTRVGPLQVLLAGESDSRAAVVTRISRALQSIDAGAVMADLLLEAAGSPP
jgi:hypothetical protein